MTARHDGSDAPLRGKRVLIVEDQYLVAREAERAVEALGGEVIGPAPGLRDAFKLIEQGGIDLALLDINLGDDDVFPIAEELSRRHVPYLLATGYEAHVVPERYRTLPRVEKPVTLRGLTEATRLIEWGNSA